MKHESVAVAKAEVTLKLPPITHFSEAERGSLPPSRGWSVDRSGYEWPAVVISDARNIVCSFHPDAVETVDTVVTDAGALCFESMHCLVESSNKAAVHIGIFPPDMDGVIGEHSSAIVSEIDACFVQEHTLYPRCPM